MIEVHASELGNAILSVEPLAFDAVELSKLAEHGISLADLTSDEPPLMAVVWAAWVHVRRSHSPALSWDEALNTVRIVFDTPSD